jgi:hypothetical protein
MRTLLIATFSCTVFTLVSGNAGANMPSEPGRDILSCLHHSGVYADTYRTGEPSSSGSIVSLPLRIVWNGALSGDRYTTDVTLQADSSDDTLKVTILGDSGAFPPNRACPMLSWFPAQNWYAIVREGVANGERKTEALVGTVLDHLFR